MSKHIVINVDFSLICAKKIEKVAVSQNIAELLDTENKIFLIKCKKNKTNIFLSNIIFNFCI